MSKLIYTPKKGSPAWEYAKYAVSFTEGCSDKNCSYCYMAAMNKRFGKYFGPIRLKSDCGILSRLTERFYQELNAKLPTYQKHGLFFIFNGDAMALPVLETTGELVACCMLSEVPVTILTKQTEWIKTWPWHLYVGSENLIAFGFTLTGHDEMEPGCATNKQRIEAMKLIHDKGFKTWASIEPVIQALDSIEMINESKEFCDLYKIGLLSGSKLADWQAKAFINSISEYVTESKIYFKDSLINRSGIKREDLPSNCVDSNYSMFSK